MVRRSRKNNYKKKDFFDALDMSLFNSSSPSCPHFFDCGGCRFQNISYADQLLIKKNYLETLAFKDINILASSQELGYRNRMDFLFNDGFFCLRQKGAFDKLVPLRSGCLLVPSQFQKIVFAIQNILASADISSYDVVLKKGFLRYVTFRFGVNTN